MSSRMNALPSLQHLLLLLTSMTTSCLWSPLLQPVFVGFNKSIYLHFNSPIHQTEKRTIKNMDWLFGKKPTPEEILKENKKLVRRSIRDIERETRRLETSEKKMVKEIKGLAEDGKEKVLKIKVKDLVRTRRQIQKFGRMVVNLEAVKIKLETLNATQNMGKAMAGATKAMQSMNAQYNLPAMQKILMDFERQSDLMENKEEMLDDTLEELMEESDEEEEAEEILQSVLAEIGVELNIKLNDIPETGSSNEQVSEGTTTAKAKNKGKVAVVEGGSSSGGSSSSGASSSSSSSSSSNNNTTTTISSTSSTDELSNSGSTDLESLQSRLDALKK
eukprot:TRINITY_DN1622_c0_g2_i9.p1 TRINITY_DN1622_c0_g2~~TRINITY_DN1622_c0_g2_i9.p1  ORF type:complete len:332 (-),score=143.79 TRINITY_DN1622_c0_g2_i9:20-1015(-)